MPPKRRVAAPASARKRASAHKSAPKRRLISHNSEPLDGPSHTPKVTRKRRPQVKEIQPPKKKKQLPPTENFLTDSDNVTLEEIDIRDVAEKQSLTPDPIDLRLVEAIADRIIAKQRMASTSSVQATTTANTEQAETSLQSAFGSTSARKPVRY